MKLTKKQFIEILTKNAGLFNRTARHIEKEFGIKMSRQGVRERAMKYPEILAEIQENNIDIAEEGLHDLMRSKSPSIKFKAIDLYLRTKARHRGYNASMDLNIDFNAMSDEQLTYILDQLQKRVKI